MADYSRTLFVCTGNVFRSITAEKLFTQYATRLNLPYQVRSRGTDPYFRTPNPLLAEIVSQRYSVNITGLQARKLSRNDIHWASAIICFTHEHRRAILKLDSTAQNRTFLLHEISSMNSSLFEDIDYYDVSKENIELIECLDVMKQAISTLFRLGTLSIVLAIYNEEKTIGNILTKLLDQSVGLPVKEIIVVSSGSTDKTNSIVDSLDSHLITLVKEDRRNGKVSAFKKALPSINGENVLLLDGDIDIDSGFLEICFRCLRQKCVPCVGRVIPLKIKSNLFYNLSLVSCEAWDKLRIKSDRAGEFLYPSGYAMLLSRDHFADAINHMSDGAINDDGSLAFLLFQKGVTFKYCRDLKVYVVFPQSFRDLFRQKIRTRMGRRQTHTHFFKQMEKLWRRELIGLMDLRNLYYVCLFWLFDAISRALASVKIKINRQPHLWLPVPSTKRVLLP